MAQRSTGEFFGAYHLIEEIGRGGSAAIYRARHLDPAYAEQLFAIKRLRPSVAGDPEVAARFRREAYVLSMLEHPNIVKTVEAGVEGEELFIVTEYVDGQNLASVLARLSGLTLPPYLAAFLVGEILAGLGYGHDFRDSGGQPIQIVHRDVKPSNVLLSYGGQIKLTDFGVATLTGTPCYDDEDTVMGTVGYIAPEVFTGQHPGDGRADIFAAGVILFELLCGVNPFGQESTSRVVRRNVNARVPQPRKVNPSLPEELEAVLLRALERDPDRRFATAEEMAAALRPFLPARLGMPLAVGSFLRGLFVSDFGRRVRGSRSRPRLRNDGRVAICAAGEKGETLCELLALLEVAVDRHDSWGELLATLSAPQAPTAIMADVSSADFSPAQFLGALRSGARIVPVVAVSEDLQPKWARAADAIGAVDLICPPFAPKRLLGALRAAMANDPARAAEGVVARVQSALDLRVRIVSADYGLAARLSRSLAEWGYEVDVSATRAEAIERTLCASPHGVIYDLGADPDPDASFVDHVRGCPGLGLLPVVFLIGTERTLLKIPERCVVRFRTDPDFAIAAAFNALRMIVHLGRTFTRYLTLLEAELCYNNRLFRAQTVDLSRGGVLLRCGQIPPVGKEVRVVIPLQGREIEAPGKVVRVQMPGERAKDQRARVGIAFKPSDVVIEEPLIAYIAALDHFR